MRGGAGRGRSASWRFAGTVDASDARVGLPLEADSVGRSVDSEEAFAGNSGGCEFVSDRITPKPA